MHNKRYRIWALLGIGFVCSLGASHARAQYFQGFNGTSLPADWTPINHSTSNATGNPWTDGPGIVDANGDVEVAPFEGDGYAITNYTATASTGTNATISNFLISPEFGSIKNGDTFSFYTTTAPASAYPDRLQLLLSKNGASTNVGTGVTATGDFSTILLDINPSLVVGGYPDGFTLETVTISGLTAPVDGRVALRYFVTKGGVNGANSNVIGVDDFSTTASVGTAAVPEPASYVAAGFGGLMLLMMARSRRQTVNV